MAKASVRVMRNRTAPRNSTDKKRKKFKASDGPEPTTLEEQMAMVMVQNLESNKGIPSYRRPKNLRVGPPPVPPLPDAVNWKDSARPELKRIMDEVEKIKQAKTSPPFKLKD